MEICTYSIIDNKIQRDPILAAIKNHYDMACIHIQNIKYYEDPTCLFKYDQHEVDYRLECVEREIRWFKNILVQNIPQDSKYTDIINKIIKELESEYKELMYKFIGVNI